MVTKNEEGKTGCPYSTVTDTQTGPKKLYFRLHKENVQERDIAEVRV